MTVIAAPSSLTRAKGRLVPRDNIAEVRAIYPNSNLEFDFGGEWWELQLTTPLMTIAESLELAGWCHRVKRAGNVARISPMIRLTRHGTSVATTLTVTANASSLARTLAVSGIGAAATLGAGTLLSIGDRLHRLEQTVTGDTANLTVWPRLRETVLSGASVVVGSGTVGAWRLVDYPGLEESADLPATMAEPMTLNFVEALNL